VTLNNQEIDPAFMIGMTVDVVMAYLSNNPARASDVPELIAATHAALAGLGIPAAAPEPAKQLPAVPIKKSVSDDYLISLEDGKRYKSLRRHLGSKGLTPDEYRQKWGLPLSYPMVAPSYAKQRSELAHAMGLGRRGAEPAPESEPVAAPAKRGRPKKV
jgi:predicted transcriptional regulator